MTYNFQGSFNKQIWDFDPRTIPACVLWLDASDASSIRLSGSNVTLWIDKSTAPNKVGGPSGIAVNGGSTNPTIATAALNGRNTIAFGGSAILSTSSNISTLPTGSASGTFFVVGKETASSGNQMLFQYGQGPSGVTNRNRQFFFSGANPTVDILTNGRNVASSQYTVNNYTMVSSVQTTTNTSYINGAIFVTTTPVAMSPNIGTNAPFFIGGGLPIDSSTPGIALTGNIAEILIYSSVLSTTERQQVEGYLAWKWGLYDLLVAGHPYKLLNSPSNVPNLALWLDAADSSTMNLSGSSVTQWRDKSGNGRNATASGSPVYTAALQNGLNVISVTGSQAFTTPT